MACPSPTKAAGAAAANYRPRHLMLIVSWEDMMNVGVCQWVFNRMFLDGEIDMLGCIGFVGTETEADCFEPLSRYVRAELRQIHTTVGVLPIALYMGC